MLWYLLWGLVGFILGVAFGFTLKFILSNRHSGGTIIIGRTKSGNQTIIGTKFKGSIANCKPGDSVYFVVTAPSGDLPDDE